MLCVCLTVLAGCGRHEPQRSAPLAAIDALQAEYRERLAAFADALGPSGWPGGDDCDGTLWAGEAAAAGVPVDLDAVEYEPGLIGRRPVPCAVPEESRSTISNDMLLGYLLGRVAQHDTDALQRLYDYASEHNGIMGEPFPEEASRVVLKYNQLVLLRKALGLTTTPPKYFGVEADYAEHLQVLSIDLYGQLWGALDSDTLAHLLGLCTTSPDDALFQAVCGVYTGDVSRATELLLAPNYQTPSYVRGPELAPQIHWLYAARTVLRAAGR